MSITDEFKKMLDDAGIEAPLSENFVFYMLECEDGVGEDTELLFEGAPRLCGTSIGPTEEERLKIIRSILFDYAQFVQSQK